MTDEEKELLSRFSKLDAARRAMLMEFAEFLRQRAEPEPPALAEPEPIERPREESVVAAIKRLSQTYHMLDKSKVLNEVSALMAQHVMHGRDRIEVIDEIEVVFRRYYQDLTQANGR